MWAAWLWLCRSSVGVAGLLPLAATHPATLSLLAAGATAVVARGVLAIGGASGALWLWNKAAGRRPGRPGTSSPNYAAYFGVSDLQLHRCRSAQVCVVHHDADGRIVAIETETPRPPTAADARHLGGPTSDAPLQHAA